AKSAGHSFAISYLTDLDTSHRVKAWTLAEVQAYRAAGLGVVAVWQGGGSDRTTAWKGGYDRGRRDALRAATQATALGRPAGRPVYFAIDADATSAQLVLIGLYFDGVASVFDRANVGVYGGRTVIEWAQRTRAASWFWQTGAWSNGVVVPGIHLFQRIPPTRLAGYDIDIDDAMRADYGAWFDAPTKGHIMQLVPRSAWGARAYKSPGGATAYSGSRRGVKVHYLGTAYRPGGHDTCAAYVRSLQASHMDGNGWSDIGYSFLVCVHGYVYEGRGLKRRNSANGTTSLNEAHYAVCGLVGSSGHTQPTTEQLHGIRDAIEYCRAQGPAGSEIRGHRDGYSTDCPGGPLYAWVQVGAPRPTTAQGDEFDMANVDEVVAKVTDAVEQRLLRTPMLDTTFPLGEEPKYAPMGREGTRGSILAQLAAEAARDGVAALSAKVDALAERIGAPTPVTVDAVAVAAALAADKSFLAAIAKAVADEDHKRTEA
ncbi:glycoside hydrolase domain-containing protein, partial [Embleya sp. NPDC001921]